MSRDKSCIRLYVMQMQDKPLVNGAWTCTLGWMRSQNVMRLNVFLLSWRRWPTLLSHHLDATPGRLIVCSPPWNHNPSFLRFSCTDSSKVELSGVLEGRFCFLRASVQTFVLMSSFSVFVVLVEAPPCWKHSCLFSICIYAAVGFDGCCWWSVD